MLAATWSLPPTKIRDPILDRCSNRLAPSVLRIRPTRSDGLQSERGCRSRCRPDQRARHEELGARTEEYEPAHHVQVSKLAEVVVFLPEVRSDLRDQRDDHEKHQGNAFVHRSCRGP